MTDAPPYAVQNKLTTWRFDRGASLGGEPYWRESGLLDTTEIARACGFVNVRAFKDPTGGNWVTIGEKPPA